MNPGTPLSVAPSKAEVALNAALRVMCPLLKFLLKAGVTHQMLCNALKKEMLDNAEKVLRESAVKVNDSSLSALTGINRKDVRQWSSVGQTLPAPNTLGPAMEVFTHWKSESKYQGANGCPVSLPRSGGKGSFEELANAVSKDVHPLTILREMERLGIAKRSADDGVERIELCVDAFVPEPGATEMLQLLIDNVGDHLSTSLSNVAGEQAPMLEQSIFAERISVESATKIGALARDIWARAQQEIFIASKPLCDADAASGKAEHRFRIGMYFHQSPPPSHE